ncbi:MAG: YraN family protein [Candidatus Niyogibacteria bacterium]|nr:YraN family protein [Candidatus Niyogibacteria bacterium]
MTYKSEIGKLGEDLACNFLKTKKYKIIERNYRKPWGELDIVALASDKTLVFVEVKTVRHGSPQAVRQSGNDIEEINPEEQMTSAKMRKFKRTAELYAGEHQELFNDKKGWRIDLLALTMKEKDFVIKHYENIA